ncbi:RNA polymerase sigma factor [Paenibacillus sacheonensis]|uniref:Sigma-70 family RNA polymerase sigma factor n=1 Tax=Paenibacillus sacheonensis TaxID=742054 RepID=A0A7X5C3D3_9BACL|nr:RNA polymerase sigma factor [Paenibacillus sacheonensis]MBM7567643.1 RNA polymerase sigma-70 factor (ECF subfamily) [Paenibacillus sacheonensis]NBC71254.1 sigma-70 family RNA polymerase sigma factor [Paenibacillus sacheonensis]
MSDNGTDAALLARILGKDPEALKLMYERYERPIYAFAYRIVKDAMLAEEVVQELFLRLWNSAERYDSGQGMLSSWLFTITRNIAIDALRLRQTRTSQQVTEAEQLNREPDPESDTAGLATANVVGEQVRSAIRSLNEDQQEVMELIYFAGYTQQEVSAKCDIPLGTVKSRVRLAMKALKTQLEDIGKEGLSYGP